MDKIQHPRVLELNQSMHKFQKLFLKNRIMQYTLQSIQIYIPKVQNTVTKLANASPHLDFTILNLETV